MPTVSARRCRAFLCCALTWAASGALHAADASPAPAYPKLTPYGDLRLRYERDWDSHTSSGALRDDRERERLRARLGFVFDYDAAWSFNLRGRTGDRRGQQSPHLTFHSSDGTHDVAAIQADRYFVQYKQGPLLVWGGRNGFPFWQQNELILDEDVTPTGAAGSYEIAEGPGKLATTLGAFALPDGMNRLHGHMTGAQVKYTTPVERGQFTTAVDLYAMNGPEGAQFLRNRNGARDYLIGALKVQWSTPVAGYPLALGADLIRNFESYSAADVAPLPARNADQRDGYDVSVQWGQLKQARDWVVAWSYIHIETLAVNASYAQDDWVRFGANGQTDGTDIKGHELRAAYAITKNINLMARAFFVDAITTVQDGKRFRFDVNFKF